MKVLALAVLFLSLVAHGPANKQKGSNFPQDNAVNDAASGSFYAHNEASCPEKKCADNEPPAWWKRPEWWLFIAALPTLFFVGWQAKATANAAEATLESVRVAEKSLILQFRPKIVIRGGHVDIDGSGTGTVEFGIINTGGSKTNIVESKLTAKLVESAIDGSVLAGGFAIDKKSFIPGESAFQIFQLDKATSNAIHWVNQQHQSRPDLSHGKTIIFAGFIKYRDDAEILRTTGIFRRYDPSKLRFVAEDDSDLEYAD